tara:strand:+ start:94 stop:966 length:873 start_codon:yes stop_codon:yes gene_type:complete
MNNLKKLFLFIASVLLIIVLFSFVMNSISKPSVDVSVDNILQNYFSSHTMKKNNDIDFDTYFTENDFIRLKQKLPILDEVRFELSSDKLELYEKLTPNDSTIVIYPIFTSAAYSDSGFYDFFSGDCDESCLNNISFKNPDINYDSSGITTQILHIIGYDFITDIDVDKNPDILKNYQTVILLHNEYVTKKMFDAITSHPNLIFLSPNALYAEIEVDYNNDTIKLIRGHDYPPGVSNGFGYEIEEQFHKYESDGLCLDWEFFEIKNGYHLNCYPDGSIHFNLELIAKIKQL